ncbi:hypothetical protein [Flavobacterium caseinilyticum]|uniref:hypothetical protein n=1 Tax=Flavobacterium caseinilyticum TaxID=2541732 RepID=UPI001A9D5813|nr:hypothetical protein [Flavobacterium caseinilyticum]
MQDFNKMMVYNENVLNALNDDEIEELDENKKITTSWKQSYDVEQLMEHAIVYFFAS